MSNDGKWGMVHSPHRRGRAQRREAHHVTSAPPNASALMVSSDVERGKESEGSDDDEYDEYDAPMWRSDIEQSAHQESSIDKKIVDDLQASAKRVHTAPAATSSSSSTSSTSSANLTANGGVRGTEDAVALEECDEIPSFTQVDKQQTAHAASAETVPRAEIEYRKTLSQGVTTTLFAQATEETKSHEIAAETNMATGRAPLDQFKLALNPTSGEVYFYNRRTRQSQWELPEPKFGVVVNMQDHPDPRAEQEYRILLATYQEEQKRKQAWVCYV